MKELVEKNAAAYEGFQKMQQHSLSLATRLLVLVLVSLHSKLRN
jgi:hypothetical protein